MDEITKLVGKNYPNMVYALDSAEVSTSDQLASLTAERDALIGILDTIVTNISGAVMAKQSPFPMPTTNATVCTVYTDLGGDVNHRLLDTTQTDNARHWTIDTANDMVLPLLSSSGNVFFYSCASSGSMIPSGSTVIWYNGSDASRVTCTSSAWMSGGGGGAAFIGCTPEPYGKSIPTGLTRIYSIVSASSITGDTLTSEQDPDIYNWMNDYDFTMDHLTHTIEADAFYGINAKLSMLSTSMNSMANNKAKQDAMDGVYRKYTQWTPIAWTSAGNLEYISETSFMIEGDMTSTFPSGTDLLIDCAADKERGCKVRTTEYIPEWMNNYTECTIVINFTPYMLSVETSALPASAFTMNFDAPSVSGGFVSISTSGGIPLSGATWVDPVTFYVPGDMTGHLLSGSQLIGVFTPNYAEDPFVERYFTVMESVNLSSSSANHTIVSIEDGLTITNNISVLNIVQEP